MKKILLITAFIGSFGFLNTPQQETNDTIRLLGELLKYNTKLQTAEPYLDNYSLAMRAQFDEKLSEVGGYDSISEALDEGLMEQDILETDLYLFLEELVAATGGWREGGAGKIPNAPNDIKKTTKVMLLDKKAIFFNKQIDACRSKLIDAYATILSKIDEQKGIDNPDKIKERVSQLEAELSLGQTQFNTEAPGNMLGVVLSNITKIRYDLKTSQIQMLTALNRSIKAEEYPMVNRFYPLIIPKKSNIIFGEEFEAQVVLAGYPSDINPSNTTLTINGEEVALTDDGMAVFREQPQALGKSKMKVEATFTDPVTGENLSVSSNFTYNVSMKAAVVLPSKMNVLYIGVENPIEIVADGISIDDMEVTCEGGGCELSGEATQRYVRVSNPRENALIGLSGEGMNPIAFEYRVKRLPDPVACFRPGATNGSIGVGEFKAQAGVNLNIDNFDFDVKCEVVGFEVIKASPEKPLEKATNTGARFSGRAAELVASAEVGDLYSFMNVKARCPGDKASRNINGMSWLIK